MVQRRSGQELGGSAAAREVPGIGPQRAPAIYKAVRERTHRDDVLIELQALEISASLAGKILRRAGADNAVANVKRDPYQLRELDGVGFATADRIAGRLGLRNDDPRRIDAGIVYALEEAARDGHCCLPPEDLAVRASKLLELSTDRTRNRLERKIRDGRELRSEERGIYLARLWYAEKDLAHCIRELMASPAKAVPLVEPDGIQLSGEQRAAVEEALRSKVFVLTGGPPSQGRSCARFSKMAWRSISPRPPAARPNASPRPRANRPPPFTGFSNTYRGRDSSGAKATRSRETS